MIETRFSPSPFVARSMPGALTPGNPFQLINRSNGTAALPSPLSGDSADAIVISDLHLGSPNCQVNALVEFLERIESGKIDTRHLVLNGDVFDSIDFRRLKKKHWKVLSLIRKLSDRITITWVCGNHDGPSEFVSHLIGTEVRDEWILQSGLKKILILHGHRFDEFIDTYPRITFMADFLYRCLQKLDRSHRIARFAKANSKVFLRCAEKIRDESIEYARTQGADIVCCGHSHHAEVVTQKNISYYNSGCWTEAPCTYLHIREGRVDLREFVSEHQHAPECNEVEPAEMMVPAHA